MADDNLPHLPNQKELEKEIADYLSRKYGGQVKIVSASLFPNPEREGERKMKIPAKKPAFHFDLKPEELAAYLDEYVIRQDEAKAILATKICTHFNRIRHDRERATGGQTGRIKSNVLLIGPTGVGKTYLIKLIARHIGVPFVKGDATKFSETGYVGGDVDDLVRDLVREADGDIDRAQFGIIYVDEIDKIASSPYRIGADVSRSGVQRAFLKPMEETEVEMKVAHDPISQLEAMEHYRATGKREKRVVNTRNILFIMSGAFAGLEKNIKKRVQQQSIGFEKPVTSIKEDARLFRQVKAEDLIEFGFESEFVGRLPVIAVLDELSEDDLFEILINPNSPVVVAKKQDFASYKIHLQFEEEALRLIAARAVRERTGARGLVSVMEHLLLHFEKSLPSTEIRYLVVTPEIVVNPGHELTKLLRQEKTQQKHRSRYYELVADEFERIVRFIHGKQERLLQAYDMTSSEHRIEMIALRCQEEIRDPRDVCNEFIALVRHIRECAEHVSGEYGLPISFDDEAIDRIVAKEGWNDVGVIERCETIFRVFEYGLKLIRQKKNVDNLLITVKGVETPDIFINDLVTEIFRL
ncbi:MAG: AAA family ATPase [Desulfobulbaceae bacterium DB1]|nr:MAG: AAA family ATPase [Desulfobulbaceae bacterium DB1]